MKTQFYWCAGKSDDLDQAISETDQKLGSQ